MERAVSRLSLDLRGAVVLTEAASGPYAVTPVLAAMAGADRVTAVTRDTRYGTVGEIRENTLALAAESGVTGIEVVGENTAERTGAADVVTNSGHLRPLNAEVIGWMKPDAVIPLMFEAWEFRPQDLDLPECLRRGIPVAGTNERHPEIDVFSYLGVMAVKQLLDAGIPAYGNRVLLLCDNDFGPFIERGLRGAGAEVLDASQLQAEHDVVLVARTPSSGSVLTPGEMELLARGRKSVIQFWGDVDRAALADWGIPFWPIEAPKPGHMGVLPSDVGPDPVVRLQAGGLKVGELLWRFRRDGLSGSDLAAALAETGYGEVLTGSA
jgi:hypothetical protein